MSDDAPVKPKPHTILICACSPFVHPLDADETDAYVAAGTGTKVCLAQVANRVRLGEPLTDDERRLFVRLISDLIVARTLRAEAEDAALLAMKPAGTC